MGTKRILYVSFFLLCTVMLVSCRHPESYPFRNSLNEISDITIVFISFSGSGEIAETELTKISDTKRFVEDFQEVSCFTWYGDPLGVTEEGVETTAIKLVYQSGDYELISWSGQSVFLAEEGLKYYAGHHVFDENQFYALLDKYLP